MTTEEWNQDFARCLGVYLAGGTLGETDARGNPVRDDDFVVLFNAHHEPLAFRLPPHGAASWTAIVDTARDDGLAADGTFAAADTYPLEGRSLVLLTRAGSAA
jgi:glycogen operon protein